MNICINNRAAERIALPAMDILPSDITAVILTAGTLNNAIKNIHMLSITSRRWRDYIGSQAGINQIIDVISKSYKLDPVLVALLLNTQSSFDWIKTEQYRFNRNQIAQVLIALIKLHDGSVIFEKAIDNFIELYNFTPVITLFIEQVIAERQKYSSQLNYLELIERQGIIKREPIEFIKGIIEQANGKYIVLMATTFKGIKTYILKRLKSNLSEESTLGARGYYTINPPVEFAPKK